MASTRLPTEHEIVEYLEEGGEIDVEKDFAEDVAVYWWAQIARDVALGRRALPQFIRSRLAEDEMAAALTDVEQIAFFSLLDEAKRDEAEAYAGRTRDRT